MLGHTRLRPPPTRTKPSSQADARHCNPEAQAYRRLRRLRAPMLLRRDGTSAHCGGEELPSRPLKTRSEERNDVKSKRSQSRQRLGYTSFEQNLEKETRYHLHGALRSEHAARRLLGFDTRGAHELRGRILGTLYPRPETTTELRGRSRAPLPVYATSFALSQTQYLMILLGVGPPELKASLRFHDSGMRLPKVRPAHHEPTRQSA